MARPKLDAAVEALARKGLYNEPEDGWVTGQALYDTELMMTTLCRFSGTPVSHSESCPVRLARQHPDVECRTLYFHADILTDDPAVLDALDVIPEEIRRRWGTGTPTATSHHG